MHIALWIIQGLLALAYLFAGFMKALRPRADVVKAMPWAAAVPSALVRFIGTAELLGAVGLIVPAVTGILTWLTPLAAAGLVVVQVLAIGFHVSRHEVGGLPMNAVLLLLAALVLFGRWLVQPLV
jgi:uncharacterized membrane protein